MAKISLREKVQQLLDRTESRWSLYVAITGSGVIMSALTAATEWLHAWGPIGWGVAFIVGALSAALLFYLIGIGASAWLSYRTRRIAIDESGTNPLDDEFDRKLVRLSDFYEPDYIPHKRKLFKKCRVVGPGSIMLLGNTNLEGSNIRHVQIVTVEPNTDIISVTAFEDCTFRDCIVANMTIFMTKDAYQKLPQNLKNIPVVN